MQEIKQHQDTIEASSSVTIVDVHCQLADRSHEQLLGEYSLDIRRIVSADAAGCSSCRFYNGISSIIFRTT